MGSSPFYIHEYVFSSKFLRNCDASKHIRFLKRTQAVNSTNKYTCVYRMYYGMVQICWTNSPFLFPWNTKIPSPCTFSSKMRWLSLLGVEGLDWTQILIWRLNFELVRVNFELILIQVFLHQNWTSNPFQSLQKSQTSNLFFQDQVKPRDFSVPKTRPYIHKPTSFNWYEFYLRNDFLSM